MPALKRKPYAKPALEFLGTVRSLTQLDPGSGLHFHQVALGSMSGTTTQPNVQPTPATTNPSGTSDTAPVPGGSTSPAPTPGQGVEGSHTSGGSPVAGMHGSGTSSPQAVEAGTRTATAGGGSGVISGGSNELPFTGLEVGPVALLGTVLASVGAALRGFARRS